MKYILILIDYNIGSDKSSSSHPNITLSRKLTPGITRIRDTPRLNE